MRPETKDQRPETPDPERMLAVAKGLIRPKARRMAMGGVKIALLPVLMGIAIERKAEIDAETRRRRDAGEGAESKI